MTLPWYLRPTQGAGVVDVRYERPMGTDGARILAGPYAGHTCRLESRKGPQERGGEPGFNAYIPALRRYVVVQWDHLEGHAVDPGRAKPVK